MWGGTGIGEPYTRAFQIGCHLDRGDLAAARRVADAALAGPGRRRGRPAAPARARPLLVAEGRPAEALAALDAHPRCRSPSRNPAWNPWRDHRGDRAGRARPHATRRWRSWQEEVALLRRWGAPSYLGTALCLLGRAARRGRARPTCARRSTVLTPTYAAVELARARCALGSRARGGRRRGGRAAARRRSTAAHDRGALGIQRARPRGARAAAAGPTTAAGTTQRLPDVDRAADPGARRRRARRPRGGAAAVPDPGHGAGRAGRGRSGDGLKFVSSAAAIARSLATREDPVTQQSADAARVPRREPARAVRRLGAPARRPRLRHGALAVEPRRCRDYPAAVAYPAFPDEVAEVLRAAAAAGLQVAAAGHRPRRAAAARAGWPTPCCCAPRR